MTIVTFNLGSTTCVTRIVHSNVVSMSRKRVRTNEDLNLSCNGAVQLVVLPRTFGGILPTVNGRLVALLGRASVDNCVNLISLAGNSSVVHDVACRTVVPLNMMTYLCLVVILKLGTKIEGLRGHLEGDREW